MLLRNMSIFGTIKTFLKLIVLTSFIVCVIQLWLTTKHYMFNEKDVANVAVKHVGKFLLGQFS